MLDEVSKCTQVGLIEITSREYNLIICWHFQSFLGTFGHSRTCLMNDNYPSLLQKKSLIKDNYPSMHKNFLDRWECVHEGGGRRQRQKLTLLSVCLLHNPQSTIHCQQATSPQSQCTMPNITSFGTRSCNMLSFKNTPSVPIFGKFLWPILYI